MKILLIFILFTILAVKLTAQNRREVINESWKFKQGDLANAEQVSLDDLKWDIVNLPHTWNLIDAFKNNNYYRGIGWYRKTINEQITEGKKYYLRFEAAFQETAVYVNGKLAGTHQGGYSAFVIDITHFLNKGTKVENSIAIKVDNSWNKNIPPLSGDFNYWGGIYRDLYFIEKPLIHFRMDNHGSDGIFINTPEVNAKSALVKIKGELVNEDSKTQKITVQAIITDMLGKTIQEIGQEIQVKSGEMHSFELISSQLKNPRLWSPEDPYLYQIAICIKDEKGTILDVTMQPLGFRWYSVDTVKGFMLNGKPLKLIGANRHQDFQGLGNALSHDLHRRDIELLKEMGVNFIRFAHYPQDRTVFESCDKLGIIAWEELALVNQISLTDEFNQTCKMNMIEMIRQLYNHPSIIFWGFSNEIGIILPSSKDTVYYNQYIKGLKDLHLMLNDVVKSEDPNRITTIAFHGDTRYNKWGLGEIPQVIGWNLYQGWYGGIFDEFGKFLDTQHKEYPNRPLIVSEYGAGSDIRLHSLNPETFDFSIEYQQLYHESYMKQIMDRDYIIGSALWNFIDFGSAWRQESMPRINNKGLVYYNREPKDIYYFYQSMLSKKPVLHIASHDWIERTGIPAKPKDDFVIQPLKLYSNLPEVELIVNGTSMGKQKISGYKTSFNIPFKEGSNIIEVKGISKDRKKLREVLTVNFHIQDYDLRKSTNQNLKIAVNAGSNCFFTDPASRVIYMPDQPYRKGSWGYTGGEIYRITKNRIGIQTEITGTDIDPIYQTLRVGMDSYQFDIPDGIYEVNLHFSEPVNEIPRLVNDLGVIENKKYKERIFNVTLNGNKVLNNLDLATQSGPVTAVIKTYRVKIENGKGLNIGFEPVKGKPIISGIEVEKLF